MDTPQSDNRPAGDGYVYARRIWHWRAKRFIYPKRARFFRFRRRPRRK